MIYEGVNFNEGAVARMGREDFIRRHIRVFWQDRDEETRRKMLGQVYELTAGKPARGRKRKAESK